MPGPEFSRTLPAESEIGQKPLHKNIGRRGAIKIFALVVTSIAANGFNALNQLGSLPIPKSDRYDPATEMSSDRQEVSESFRELKSMFEDITTADGAVYQPKDDQKIPLETVKIIQLPDDSYLFAYHYQDSDGIFRIRLASSRDLLSGYQQKTILETDASNPDLVMTDDNTFLLAYEKVIFRFGPIALSRIGLKFFLDKVDLSKGTSSDSIILKKIMNVFDFNKGVKFSQGTPSIESVDMSSTIKKSKIKLKYHNGYNRAGDLEGIGELDNFDQNNWNEMEDDRLNTLFRKQGVNGKIGSRCPFVFKGKRYHVIEAQLKKDDDSTWRIFLYEESTGMLKQLNIKTHKGSTSFANPMITFLKLPNGKDGFVISLYIKNPGAAEGEEGPVIYYRELPTNFSSPDESDQSLTNTSSSVADFVV